MSLVNVAMSKWIIDVATGAQEGNIYLVATIVALSFLLGMGIKTCISLDFWQDQHAHQYPHAKFAVRRLMMCSWKGAGKWHTATC